MGNAAAQKAYDFLIAQLRSTIGLEWVAEQIENEVALGALAEEKIAVAEETHFKLSYRLSETLSRSAPKADFLTRTEYSPREKFNMVVEAIESVVIGGAKIQSELVRAIATENSSVSVMFEPGKIGTLRHGYESTQLLSLEKAGLQLQSELAALREDVARAD
jgi:hypothetical protein